jgi:O-antigen ligase
METKHLIALIMLVVAACGGTLLATLSRRFRELAFFAMVALAVLIERGGFDANLFGQYWYRGTSRGIGVSLIDVLAWCVLVSSLLAPTYPRRPWFVPASLVLFGVYFVYCVFSVVRSDPWIFGTWELANIPRAMLVLLAAAAFVRTRRELGILVLALGTAVLIQAAYAVNQRVVRGMFRPCGTLDHANSLSMYLCTVAPVLLAASLAQWNRWLRLFGLFCSAVASVVVLLTLSRAGLPIFIFIMAGTAVMCTRWRITRQKVYVMAIVSIAAIAMFARSWDMLAVRFGSATLKEEFVEIEGENRGVYWRWAGMMIEDHPFGIGLNNWSYAVSKTYGARLGFRYEDYDDIKTAPEKADIPSIRYAPPAHALAALTLGELGIPGLLIFLLLWMRWFQMGGSFFWRRLDPDPMHRIAIGIFFGTVGIFLQGITEWTYRQAQLFLTFHTLIGVLVSLYYVRRHPAQLQLAREVPQARREEEYLPATTAARTASP